MEDSRYAHKPTPAQAKTRSSGPAFEEELRQQNIKTMIEIYGKAFWEKMCKGFHNNTRIH